MRISIDRLNGPPIEIPADAERPCIRLVVGKVEYRLKEVEGALEISTDGFEPLAVYPRYANVVQLRKGDR